MVQEGSMQRIIDSDSSSSPGGQQGTVDLGQLVSPHIQRNLNDKYTNVSNSLDQYSQAITKASLDYDKNREQMNKINVKTISGMLDIYSIVGGYAGPKLAARAGAVARQTKITKVATSELEVFTKKSWSKLAKYDEMIDDVTGEIRGTKNRIATLFKEAKTGTKIIGGKSQPITIAERAAAKSEAIHLKGKPLEELYLDRAVLKDTQGLIRNKLSTARREVEQVITGGSKYVTDIGKKVLGLGDDVKLAFGGAASAAKKSGSMLKTAKTIGTVTTLGVVGTSVLGAVKGPGKGTIGIGLSKVGDWIGQYNEGIGRMFQKAGKSIQGQAMEETASAANWLGFMAEDTFQPLSMQVANLRKSGNLKGAIELNEALQNTISGFSIAGSEMQGFVRDQLDFWGIAEDDNSEHAKTFRKLIEAQFKGYQVMGETLVKSTKLTGDEMKQELIDVSTIELFDPIQKAADKAKISVAAMNNKLHILSTTSKAIERDRGIQVSLLQLEQEKYSTAQRKFGLISNTRFVGEVGMQRDMAGSQNVAQLAQLSMMQQFGANSTFGQAQSGFGLQQLAGSFAGMQIQKNVLSNSKGTIDYDKYTKELMEHNKEQQIAALDFQLLHKDEITAYEEKKIKLQELNEIVSMTQLEYQTSFGYMRTQVQLTAQEINDNLLKAEGLLFEGAEDASIALNNQADAMSIAKKAMEPYQAKIKSLDQDMLLLNIEISNLYDNKGLISEVMSDLRNEAQDTIDLINEANSSGGGGSSGGSSGGGSSGGSGENSGGPSQSTIDGWIQDLRSGGVGAYIAADKLRENGWNGDYRGYHSGGAITSDQTIRVQKGEQIIAKEHASRGQIVIKVENHFTGISVADQDSIAEQVSENVINKLREVTG